jgi:hypothetical protein
MKKPCSELNQNTDFKTIYLLEIFTSVRLKPLRNWVRPQFQALAGCM